VAGAYLGFVAVDKRMKAQCLPFRPPRSM